jgi:phosphoribosylanthranilate isomerase
LSLGFAGGLNPQNIDTKIGTLVECLPSKNFSIDIESGVRDDEDNLDLPKVKDYIEKSSKLLV